MRGKWLWIAVGVVGGCQDEPVLMIPPPDPPPLVQFDTAEPPVEDTGVIATAPMYANTQEALYEIDPDSGLAIRIGDFHENGQPFTQGFEDIAIDLQGRLYGGMRAPYESDTRAIYRIDPSTAQVIHICDLQIRMTAMTFLADGRLVAGGDETLHVIDIDEGCMARQVISNPDYVTSGDIVGLPDGYLYWTIRNRDDEDGGDELVKVDVDSGLSAVLGTISHRKLYGLGYDEGTGKVYGFSSYGDIVEVAPEDADSELLGTQDAVSWWGAATNPVLWD